MFAFHRIFVSLLDFILFFRQRFSVCQVIKDVAHVVPVQTKSHTLPPPSANDKKRRYLRTMGMKHELF